MELRHIRYFMAVADHLHFGNAAQHLNVAQPALSVQIKQLESMLGGELFHRGSRTVALTEGGRLFYAEARKILQQTSHAETIAKAALQGQKATFEIGYSGNAAFSSGLKRVIDVLRRSGASVDIALHELDAKIQLEALAARKIHFGFVTTIKRSSSAEFAFMRLDSWPLLLAVHQSHTLAHQETVRLSDIEHEGFIACDDGDGDQNEISFLVERGFTPKISQRVQSGGMIVRLVAAGMGVALIPSSLADPHFGEDVVFRSVIDVTEQLDCSLVFLHEQYEPAVRRALATIASEFNCLRPVLEELPPG